MLKLTFSTIALLAVLATSTLVIDAFEPEADRGLIGQTVTVVTDIAVLTRKDQIVDHPDLGESFKIDDVKGNRLFVKSRNANLQRSDVVLYRDAIEYFTRKIEKEPLSDYYDMRGRCWQKRGALKPAIDDFNKAIEIDPQNYAAFVNRGIAWEEKYDLDRAIADFDEAIRIRPGYLAAVADRGGAWARKGNFEKAIADWSEAIRISPEDVLSYNNRGWAYLHIGDVDAAMKDLDEATRRDPNYATAYKNRADVWIIKHEYDKAIAESNEAIRRNSTDARFFITRANARIGKGLTDAAVADLEEATRLDPTLGRNSMAWLRATSPDPKIRNGKEAIHEATKACELSDWKYDSHLHTLSAALAEQGKFEEAIKRLQQAIEANPDHEKELRKKMMAAFKAGKPYQDAEYRLLP